MNPSATNILSILSKDRKCNNQSKKGKSETSY